LAPKTSCRYLCGPDLLAARDADMRDSPRDLS
jgi:hypothetical protein